MVHSYVFILFLTNVTVDDIIGEVQAKCAESKEAALHAH